MKKIFIGALLVSFAHAAPANFWVSGFGQGWQEYSIDSANKISVRISCNVGYDSETDHSVSIHKNGSDKEINGNVAFVINGAVYTIPNRGPHGLATSTRGGGNEWDNAMMALAKATKFDLYINDKFVAKFTPSKANLKSILGNEYTFCTSQFANQ